MTNTNEIQANDVGLMVAAGYLLLLRLRNSSSSSRSSSSVFALSLA
jgi:hypothetical protein